MEKLNFREIFLKYRLQVLFVMIGLIIIIGGLLFQKISDFTSSKIEVLGDTTTKTTDVKTTNIIVEVVGSVENPGVYDFPLGSRVEDALIKSGGMSANADRIWVDKNLNRAAKLTDGQKIYIPYKQSLSQDKQSEVSSASNFSTTTSVAQSDNTSHSNLVNINTAGLSDLDTLSGIGPVYAQSIIDHRPYSNIDELLSKKVIPQSTFTKIKDQITVY